MLGLQRRIDVWTTVVRGGVHYGLVRGRGYRASDPDEMGLVLRYDFDCRLRHAARRALARVIGWGRL